MNPKEIRKKILELLYKERSEFMVETKVLEKELGLPENELDQEIRYLEEKGYLEIKSEFMGRQYLNFPGIKITAYGIDLVEDPEEFDKLFAIKINTFGDISNSNLSIDSSNVSQIIKDNNIDKELKDKLEELTEAIKKKDKSKIMSILAFIADKSTDVLIAILTSGHIQS